MESTLSATNLFNSFKTLTSSTKPSISHLRLLRYEALLNEGLQKRFSFGKFTCVGSGDFHNSNEYISISSSANLLRSLHSMAPIWSPVPRCWTSAASFACGVGGGDGSNGGETKSESIGGQSEEILALSPDVVILDVEGMMCEGCTASVKRILESQPQVSSANVNLATNTAVVWPVSDTKDTHNWQQQLGDALAKHLTNCGFKSNPRDIVVYSSFNEAWWGNWQDKEQLKEALHRGYKGFVFHFMTNLHEEHCPSYQRWVLAVVVAGFDLRTAVRLPGHPILSGYNLKRLLFDTTLLDFQSSQS